MSLAAPRPVGQSRMIVNKGLKPFLARRLFAGGWLNANSLPVGQVFQPDRTNPGTSAARHSVRLESPTYVLMLLCLLGDAEDLFNSRNPLQHLQDAVAVKRRHALGRGGFANGLRGGTVERQLTNSRRHEH